MVARLRIRREANCGKSWSSNGIRPARLRSTSDRVVVPTDTAELEGALNVEVQEVCPATRTSHGDLPGDPVTLRVLAGTLGAGRPMAPSDVSC